jgi:hypothetical protein
VRGEGLGIAVADAGRYGSDINFWHNSTFIVSCCFPLKYE